MATETAPDRTFESSPGQDPLVPLVAEVARGSEAALQALYAATCPRALGIATGILRDRASAEDAVVEVYTQVWSQAARYDPAKGFVSTWIATLARTRAIDLLRARQRLALHLSAVGTDTLASLCDPAEGPLEFVSGDDRAERVRSALRALPQEQRTAVEAAFFQGFSHTEIAAALGQPLGTVKTRIRTGLMALRRALAALEGELT